MGFPFWAYCTQSVHVKSVYLPTDGPTHGCQQILQAGVALVSALLLHSLSQDSEDLYVYRDILSYFCSSPLFSEAAYSFQSLPWKKINDNTNWNKKCWAEA